MKACQMQHIFLIRQRTLLNGYSLSTVGSFPLDTFEWVCVGRYEHLAIYMPLQKWFDMLITK